MNTDNTSALAKREVWLLNKCSLCGYLPLVQTERDGFGKTWHYHKTPTAPDTAMDEFEAADERSRHWD